MAANLQQVCGAKRLPRCTGVSRSHPQPSRACAHAGVVLPRMLRLFSSPQGTAARSIRRRAGRLAAILLQGSQPSTAGAQLGSWAAATGIQGGRPALFPLTKAVPLFPPAIPAPPPWIDPPRAP
eukprot:scaffold4755_cov123-Isochrysis_galbana.AAC.8